LDTIVQDELKELEDAEKLEKRAIEESRKAVTHIYMGAIILFFGNIKGKLIDLVSLVPGTSIVKDFFNKPAVAAVFKNIVFRAIYNFVCELLKWLAVPPLMLLEAIISWWVSTKVKDVKELLHLDVNENLVDTVVDTVIAELDYAIEEVKKEHVLAP
jgi:hypothetical protein